LTLCHMMPETVKHFIAECAASNDRRASAGGLRHFCKFGFVSEV
jgi:hypothetical protein